MSKVKIVVDEVRQYFSGISFWCVCVCSRGRILSCRRLFQTIAHSFRRFNVFLRLAIRFSFDVNCSVAVFVLCIIIILCFTRIILHEEMFTLYLLNYVEQRVLHLLS